MTSPIDSNALSPTRPDESAFDDRIVEIDLITETGTQTFSGLAIYAAGSKFGNALMNTCECRIYNLSKELRNYILTQASPLKSPRTPINLNLKVGRKSTGLFLLFTGQVISCNVTQPPDIGVTLRSLSSNYFTGAILAVQQPGYTLLSKIAQTVAANLNLVLDFEATDKQIDNYCYTASAMQGVEDLNEMGGIQAFIDNDTLVVIDAGKARKGEPRLLSESTGMIGIPQVTDQGVIVGMMIDNSVQLGGSITVESVINPAANGTYKVVKIDYQIANRDQPFWYQLICSNVAYYQGQQ